MLSPNATGASFQHRLAGFAEECLPNHWADAELLFPNLVRDGLPINRQLIGLLRWFQTPELWLKTRSVRLWVLGVLQQLSLAKIQNGFEMNSMWTAL
jgi:hypothetical protein